MWHPALFEEAVHQYNVLFIQLKSQPEQQKLEFAKKNKELLLGMTHPIPSLLTIFSDDDQLAFLNGPEAGITVDNLKVILINIRLAANKSAVAAANEANITDKNLADITEELFPDAKDRLNYISARINKVTAFNFISIASILPKEEQEQFINMHIDRLAWSNIVGIISFISPSNQLKFLTAHPFINANTIALLAEKLTQQEDRDTFIQANQDKVTLSNFILLTSLLTEDNRMLFATRHTQYVSSQNLVPLLELGSIDTRTIWMVHFKKCIDASNFKNIIGLTPQEFQLAFFQQNLHFLEGKSRGVWGEHLAQLSDEKDRYTFFQAHQSQLCNPKEDIISIAWVMEQFSTQHALMLAKDNVSHVHELDQIKAFLNCKTLDFAARLTLIEAYKPIMLKQADKVDQTFKIRKYLAEQLKQVTGKDYPRGDKTDLQALAILINIAKQHLGIKTSNHDPKVFGTATQSEAVAIDVDASNQHTQGSRMSA